MTRTLIAATALAMGLLAQAALAAKPSCEAQASEKKLAGAARTSFVKKCESDIAAACETQADEKKLAGAARNSFVKKCITDAGGTDPKAGASAKCEAQADEKKLSGAARSSFVKKCITDAGN